MEMPKDTFKVQLLSDEYKIKQTSDRIIVIEQKEKEPKQKEFFETTLFISFLYPLLITLIVFFIMRFITRKKDKSERKLINEEINQIKRDFQPYVLAALQKTQETILNDKINTLRKIIKFKSDLLDVRQSYYDGQPSIEGVDEYYDILYNIIKDSDFNNFKKIVVKNGYLFPNNIKVNLNSISNDLGSIISIQDREFSKDNPDTPNDAFEIIKKIDDKFDMVIEEIRKDLHLDNTFIHDFIEKYKKI